MAWRRTARSTTCRTGTGVPYPGRGAPGYLIRTETEVVAFDLGPGSVHRWADAGVLSRDVSEIYITHLHPDHLSDLPVLLFSFRNPLYRRETSLRIIGPAGLKDFHRGLLHLYGDRVEEVGYDLEIVESRGGEFHGNGYSVVSERVAHTPESLGYRIESNEGGSLVYSGDTDDCEGIRKLGLGADLLLFECSVPEEERMEGHLTPTLAGRIAAACRAGKLVLTHFYPRFEGVDIVERVRREFDGDLIVGEDMMSIDVPKNAFRPSEGE
jgi:ribonuclease BN (tRNA processing enzyme)